MRSQDGINPRTTRFVYTHYAYGNHATITCDLEIESSHGQPNPCRAPVLAFDHTPPTRSQPSGLYGVMAYETGYVAHIYTTVLNRWYQVQASTK